MKKAKKSKHTKQWFYAVRGSYLPQTWQGWALYVPFVLFLVTVMQSAMRSHDSAGNVFYAIFPQWVAAAVVMTWLAKLKSN